MCVRSRSRVCVFLACCKPASWRWRGRRVIFEACNHLVRTTGSVARNGRGSSKKQPERTCGETINREREDLRGKQHGCVQRWAWSCPARQSRAVQCHSQQVRLSLSVCHFLFLYFYLLYSYFRGLGQTFGLPQSFFRGDSISTIVSITIVALCLFSCALQQAHTHLCHFLRFWLLFTCNSPSCLSLQSIVCCVLVIFIC